MSLPHDLSDLILERGMGRTEEDTTVPAAERKRSIRVYLYRLDLYTWARAGARRRGLRIRMTDAEMNAYVADVIAELRAEEEAKKAALEAAQSQANAEHAERINASLPARVRVGAHASDAEWERGTCDRDREGWVRTPAEQNAHGYWWAYIEDMTPGDDNNPSRYHEPRHVHVIEEVL